MRVSRLRSGHCGNASRRTSTLSVQSCTPRKPKPSRRCSWLTSGNRRRFPSNCRLPNGSAGRPSPPSRPLPGCRVRLGYGRNFRRSPAMQGSRRNFIGATAPGSCLSALSREEAEQRHRDREDYVMVVRLADGLLLKIAFSGWDRNNPEIHTYVSTWSPRASLHIELHGASHFAAARTWSDRDQSGVVELWSIDVYQWHPRRSIWHCFISLENDEKAVHDSRGGETKSTRSSPTAEERELVTLPIPSLGEYAAVAARLQALLRVLGYGEFK